MDKRHYAIYGGSFDPVHNGHIALASHASSECGIDKVIFMPAYVSPFKQDRRVTPGADRVRMIESVLRYHPSFCVSRYELSKEGPSYTVETLRHWSRLLGGKLSFILGYDSVMQVDTWYCGEEILRNYSLITARRPDTDDAAGIEKIRYLREKYDADITVMKMEPVDASSSEIRQRVRDGESLDGLVPPEVERYIARHDLYKEI